MNPKFFEQPILNAPYEAPSRLWELDGNGQRLIETRRQVRFDSVQLESGEGLDQDFRDAAADEIERFRGEEMDRTAYQPTGTTADVHFVTSKRCWRTGPRRWHVDHAVLDSEWEGDYKDHAPPHFHARYGGGEAQFNIATGERLAGRLPPRVQGLVSEWLEMHREALHDNWTRACRCPGIASRREGPRAPGRTHRATWARCPGKPGPPDGGLPRVGRTDSRGASVGRAPALRLRTARPLKRRRWAAARVLRPRRYPVSRPRPRCGSCHRL